MDHRTPTPDNPWLALRNLTPARIALGRTGTSPVSYTHLTLPTTPYV